MPPQYAARCEDDTPIPKLKRPGFVRLVVAASSGIYSYGGYGDLDGLFREQASELDPKKREAILHRIQQLMHEKVMYLPIWQLSVLNGYGPRVAESGLGLITDYPWSAPYEDMKLKAK